MQRYIIESDSTGPDWIDSMPKGSDYYTQVYNPDMSDKIFFAPTPQAAMGLALEYIATQTTK